MKIVFATLRYFTPGRTRESSNIKNYACDGPKIEENNKAIRNLDISPK